MVPGLRQYCRKTGGGKPARPETGRGTFSAGCYHRRGTAGGRPPVVRSLETSFMAAVGRLGQVLGLAIPAAAVVLELNRAISLGQMLVMLVAAVCCFSIGRILEAYGRR
jgi:hypothetical protein